MNSRDDLDSLRRTDQRTSGPGPASAPKPEADVTSTRPLSMPQGPTAHGQTSSPAVRLELVATRDRMIQTELLRLQRTLSRQNFRGAESARRLVRKLARKAEQNISEVESLIRSVG